MVYFPAFNLMIASLINHILFVYFLLILPSFHANLIYHVSAHIVDTQALKDNN